jgi:pimeloyl-ACP methyl ester carboxylesterase
MKALKVVLLHAWPLDEWMWEPQLRALERAGFDPIAPRLYGRGPSIDGWAAQILREHDGPFVAVGASMGGYCALALARRAPERVVGMVLAGSKATADDMDRRKHRNEVIGQLHEHGINFAPDTTVPANELAVAQEAMRDRLDLTGIVSSFGGPLLVCVGDADELVPVEEAEALAASALVGSLEVFEDAGHFLVTEQPQRFTDVLLAFLEQWKDGT